MIPMITFSREARKIDLQKKTTGDIESCQGRGGGSDSIGNVKGFKSQTPQSQTQPYSFIILGELAP